MATIPTNLPELDEKQIDAPLDLSDIELAYAAGIVDGEGCIHIKKQSTKTRAGSRSTWYTVKVTVTNTKPELAAWFKHRFGGHVGKPNSRLASHKPAYTWALANHKSVRFIRAILPFLLLKREQALVAIELQDFIDANGRRPSVGRAEIQAQFKVRMGELNRKGVLVQ